MKTLILFVLLLFVVWNVPQPAFSKRLWDKAVKAVRKALGKIDS